MKLPRELYMQIEQAEGITLQATSFRERDKIITVFTKEKGLLSFFVKRLSPKKSALLPLASVFCLAEFIYRRGRGEIFSLCDGTILDEHLFIRNSLTRISCAAEMARVILASQLPCKPSPGVYLLFKSYLRQIPHFANPKILSASFYLKVLLHEGLLQVKEEDETMRILSFARRFETLKKVKLNQSTEEEIIRLFQERV